jgi:hypothetical protein
MSALIKSRMGGTRRRRGSMYLYVLIVSTLVSLLGLSALMVTRIHRQLQQNASDASQARLYAQAALRIGMHRIKSDPDWRFSYPNGTWEADVTIGNGTYTLEGVDPSDNDLTDRADEPVVLTGIGRRGDAIHKIQITLVPTNRGFDCLKSALHAGNDLKVNGVTLNCDHVGSANHNVDCSSAKVNCDVQGVNDVKGGTYNGDTEVGIDPRVMPDPNAVLDFYLANGTWIDKDSLDFGYSNVLKNPGFESGTTDWTGDNCTLEQETVDVHGGAAAVKATLRTVNYAGPEQDVTGLLQNGVKFDVQAWIKMLSPSDVETLFGLKVVSTGSGTQSFYTSHTNLRLTDDWTLVVKDITPTWTGTLTSATLKVRTNNGDVTDFLADDMLFKEAGSDRTICRKLLSPSSNPFGAETNPQGIYLIDLADDKVFIKYSRIVGTLVLIRPHTDSRIGDNAPLTWEPAVAGLPALLATEKDLTIDPSNAGLVESDLQVNFNPPGTPYAGSSDSDLSDTYASEIKGLIYCTHKLKFMNQASLTGAAVAGNNIEVTGPFDVTYNPSYFHNPPPGFNGPEEIRVLLNSVKKPLD